MRSRGLGTHTLATLASGAAILASTRIDANRLQGCRIQRVNYALQWQGLALNDGPILFGLSVGLTVGEIGEWFTTDPQFEGDPGLEEESQRHAIILAALGGADSYGPSVFDGLSVWRRGKFPWPIIEGQALNTFVLNADPSALQTGGIVRSVTEFLGEWLHD